MIPLSDVAWGPTDALSNDRRFSDKWIEPEDIKRCLAPARWIVSGEKGSGKSAIRRAITELYKEDYFATAVADFNNITFRALYQEVLEFTRTIHLSKTAVLAHIWQYALIVELVKECSRKDPKLFKYILGMVPNARISSPLHVRLLGLLEEAWNKVDEFTGMTTPTARSQKRKPANLLANSGLTASLLGELSNFPLDKKYLSFKKAFFETLAKHDKKVILILDGFDRLRNDGAPAEAIKLVFASLVEAILELKTDPDLPETFNIKALIPHDRYLGLALRDSDKVDTMHWSIRWTKDSLREFVGKRIEIATKMHAASFPMLWKQVFPDYVTNSRYKLAEESFDYILRHSMYRPRHIQVHLEYLASNHKGANIDPTMVPNAISESSKNIARYFIEEYSIDHPNLGRFVQLFHEKENIMEYSRFREAILAAIKRFQGDSTVINVEEKVDNLYAMGFFGLVKFVDSGVELGNRYYPPTRESTRHFVDFFYKNPNPTISGQLRDESLVALHPIFIDFANLKCHPSLIVG